jgi:hypothetical protein
MASSLGVTSLLHRSTTGQNRCWEYGNIGLECEMRCEMQQLDAGSKWLIVDTKWGRWVEPSAASAGDWRSVGG